MPFRAVLGILIACWLVLAPDISHAKAPGNHVLDALLEVEASHASLCPSTLAADATRLRIEGLAGEALAQLAGAQGSGPADPEAIVRLVNGIIFGPGGLRSSQDLHDPCNLFVSGVLARGQGYCVGIAGVYLSVAEELGLPIKAVATPTHVFLRYDDGKTRINIETFNGGASVPNEQYVSQQRIAPESIRKGVFLHDLSTDQFLAQVHNNLGVIYSERRDYARADEEYEVALRLDKRLPAAWYNRGKNLLEQGDLEGAIRSFTKALRLHPNDTWALNNRGLAYRQLGKAEKARADFEAALRIDPAFEPARIGLQRTPAETGSSAP
jgi:regulator of sirC expression with transglutaminase-like and TPR domain